MDLPGGNISWSHLLVWPDVPQNDHNCDVPGSNYTQGTTEENTR